MMLKPINRDENITLNEGFMPQQIVREHIAAYLSFYSFVLLSRSFLHFICHSNSDTLDSPI
jgi:hypothetical protein